LCIYRAPDQVRVDTDFMATPFKAKISNAEQLRVHMMLVIGGNDSGKPWSPQSGGRLAKVPFFSP